MSDLFHPPSSGQLFELAQGSIEGGVMRATLEQLKAMSDQALQEHWLIGRFPFDSASCGVCLTNHAFNFCGRHKGLIPEKLGWNETHRFRANLEELYALRLFYDSLYPPSEEAPSRCLTRVEVGSEAD